MAKPQRNYFLSSFAMLTVLLRKTREPKQTDVLAFPLNAPFRLGIKFASKRLTTRRNGPINHDNTIPSFQDFS